MRDQSFLHTYWSVGLVLLLALCLRLPALDESAYYDEILAMNSVDAPDFSTYWQQQNEFYPPTMAAPLYFCIQYGWAQIVGPSVMATRVLSLIFAMGALVMVYVLGRRLFDHRTGLLALLLCSVSLSNINFSVEARMYGFMYLLTIVSVYSFIRVCEHPQRRWWVLHVGVNFLLTATHTFAALLLFAQIAYLLIVERKKLRLITTWVGIHFVLFLMTCLWVWKAWSTGFDSFIDDQYAVPTVSEIANTLVVYAGGRFTNWDPSIRMPMGISADVILAGVSYLAVLLLGLRLVRSRKSMQERKSFMLIFLWLVAPLGVLIVMSYAVKPYFVYRYALPSSMALSILVAAYMMGLQSSSIRKIVMGGLLVLLSYQLLALREPMRPDYTAIANDILEAEGEQARVYTYKSYNAKSLAFNSTMSQENINIIHSPEELEGIISSNQWGDDTAWIVFWRWDLLDSFETSLATMGYRHSVETYGGLPRMHVYRIERDENSALRTEEAR